jgi:cytochrome P450
MGDMTAGEAGLVFVDPTAYADEDRFHRACTVLRREAPVHLVEHPQFNPFYAVTRYADILEVENHPDVFRNAPRSVLEVAEADRLRESQGDVIRTLIHMDDPDHRTHRAVTADWFLPKGLGRYQARIDELAEQAVEGTSGRTECEFVGDVAAAYPLQGILAILGLPDEDYPRMLKLTQEIFGAADPDQARGPAGVADLLAAFGDCFLYSQFVRMEIRALFAELLPRLATLELAGRPEWTQTLFVGGLKRLPIRYELLPGSL